MLHIDESFLDQTVRLPVGQVLELRLKETPTSGFRWTFTENGAPACAVIGDAFQSSGTQPGASGEHAWQIKAVHLGTCELQLVYTRSFEPNTPPARSFSFKVAVTN